MTDCGARRPKTTAERSIGVASPAEAVSSTRSEESTTEGTFTAAEWDKA